MFSHLRRLVLSALVVLQLGVPGFAFAQDLDELNRANAARTANAQSSSGGSASVQSGLNATARAGTLGDFCGGVAVSACLIELVGNTVQVILGFTGVVLLGYMLYAGFLWMTSGGESERAGEAMTMIRNAVIGMVILAASFAISSFVLNSLASISGGNASRASPTTPAQPS